MSVRNTEDLADDTLGN